MASPAASWREGGPALAATAYRAPAGTTAWPLPEPTARLRNCGAPERLRRSWPEVTAAPSRAALSPDPVIRPEVAVARTVPLTPVIEMAPEVTARSSEPAAPLTAIVPLPARTEMASPAGTWTARLTWQSSNRFGRG